MIDHPELDELHCEADGMLSFLSSKHLTRSMSAMSRDLGAAVVTVKILDNVALSLW